MKKILSITLAAVMLLSLVPTAFAAENNWQGGTKVEYTATANEQYTVTVPATLAPGGSGDVVASGTWGSNRKLVVTADDSVKLTNSINSADYKDLAVTFADIKLVGDNTQAVSETKQVSVAAMPADALFGTWSGTFYYDVEMFDADAALPISFTIDGTVFETLEGTTWQEWIDSDSNYLDLELEVDGTVQCGTNDRAMLLESQSVKASDQIVADGQYTIFNS